MAHKMLSFIPGACCDHLPSTDQILFLSHRVFWTLSLVFQWGLSDSACFRVDGENLHFEIRFGGGWIDLRKTVGVPQFRGTEK